MAEFSIKNLIGFKIGKNKEVDTNIQSFTPPTDDDGAISVSATTPGIYGTYLDQEGIAKNESELIIRYREMASQPEIESAIDDIVNEAIVQDSDGRVINIILDKLEESDKVKKAIENEFKNIIKLLNFSNIAQDIFRRFYIDGRLYYHVIIDKERPDLGIQELRYVDPRKIKKIREIKKSKDSKTGVDVVIGVNEYYVYNDLSTAVGAATNNFGPVGTIISPDSIINVNSGLMDAKRTMILSYLHKCLEGNQRVKTKEGWKFVKDIIPGDLIYAYNINNDIFEETKVKNQWKTGNKKVIKISSKHSSLICTPDHPILIKDENNEIRYVNAEDIIIKKHKIKLVQNEIIGENIPFPILDRDIVAKISNPEEWIEYEMKGKKKFIYEIAEKYNQNKHNIYSFIYGYQPLEINLAKQIVSEFPINLKLAEKYEGHYQNELILPEYIDEDFSRLFGFLIGDGWVNTYTIGFAEGIDIKQNEYYGNLMKKYFGNCSRIDANSRKSEYKSWVTNNTLGCELLKSMGFITGAKNKRIPEWVFLSKKSVQLAFIEGLLDADGCDRRKNDKDTWASTINLCNEKLIYDIKELWTRLGYCSGKISYFKIKGIHIAGSKNKSQDSEYWSIYISKKILPSWENIIKIEDLENTEEVYDIEVENKNHNFVVNGIVCHNCIKPFNQLRMIEDACVIWKVSRAAQRRLYYIDVGNLPKAKAEQVIKDYQVRFRNKVVYNAESGQIQNDRRFISMLEDFFIPRRNDSKTTEITTLNDTSSFDDMSMVEYFEEKLYKSLSVPISRLNTEVKFSLGRSSEITRDELKFSKFVQRLRNRFSDIFDQALRIQCILKGICTDEEWESFKDYVIYDYVKDNYFEELKESEVLQDRLATLSTIDLYVGKYISEYWVRKNVLKMTDEEIKIEDETIRKEKQKNIIDNAQNNLLQININNELGLNQFSNEENPEEQIV